MTDMAREEASWDDLHCLGGPARITIYAFGIHSQYSLPSHPRYSFTSCPHPQEWDGSVGLSIQLIAHGKEIMQRSLGFCLLLGQPVSRLILQKWKTFKAHIMGETSGRKDCVQNQPEFGLRLQRRALGGGGNLPVLFYGRGNWTATQILLTTSF